MLHFDENQIPGEVQSNDQTLPMLHDILRQSLASVLCEFEDFTVASPSHRERIEAVATRALRSIGPLLRTPQLSGWDSPSPPSLGTSSWNGSQTADFCETAESDILQVLTDNRPLYRSKPASAPKRAVIHALAHVKGLRHDSVRVGDKKAVLVYKRNSSSVHQDSLLVQSGQFHANSCVPGWDICDNALTAGLGVLDEVVDEDGNQSGSLDSVQQMQWLRESFSVQQEREALHRSLAGKLSMLAEDLRQSLSCDTIPRSKSRSRFHSYDSSGCSASSVPYSSSGVVSQNGRFSGRSSVLEPEPTAAYTAATLDIPGTDSSIFHDTAWTESTLNLDVDILAGCHTAQDSTLPTYTEPAPCVEVTRAKRQRPGVNAFPCPGCSEVFSRACDMHKHKQKHDPVSSMRHSCEICGKRFRYPKDVRRHVSTH